MKRYYFIDDDLDDLKHIEDELEQAGVEPPHIHVLSKDDSAVEAHGLNEVHTFLKQDVVHSGQRGALIGLVLSALSIAVAWISGLPNILGWVPFLFLSIILLGFFTWEGGLFGIQEPNSRFRRFDRALQEGRHVFMVDVDPAQERVLQQVIASHPRLHPAGTGAGAPAWLLACQDRWRHFLKWAP